MKTKIEIKSFNGDVLYVEAMYADLENDKE